MSGKWASSGHIGLPASTVAAVCFISRVDRSFFLLWRLGWGCALSPSQTDHPRTAAAERRAVPRDKPHARSPALGGTERPQGLCFGTDVSIAMAPESGRAIPLLKAFHGSPLPAEVTKSRPCGPCVRPSAQGLNSPSSAPLCFAL